MPQNLQTRQFRHIAKNKPIQKTPAIIMVGGSIINSANSTDNMHHHFHKRKSCPDELHLPEQITSYEKALKIKGFERFYS